jgi:hypothetical protein
MDTGDFTEGQVMPWIATLTLGGFFGTDEQNKAKRLYEEGARDAMRSKGLPSNPPPKLSECEQLRAEESLVLNRVNNTPASLVSDTLKPRLTQVDGGQDGGQDAAQLLWMMFYERLLADESGFKHQLVVLDDAVKRMSPLSSLSGRMVSTFAPFSAISNNCPWQGCKFVASVVLYMVSNTDSRSKQDAVRPFCHSLGGCTLPPDEELRKSRWPYALVDAFAAARYIYPSLPPPQLEPFH